MNTSKHPCPLTLTQAGALSQGESGMPVDIINNPDQHFTVDQSPKITQLLHAISDGETDAQEQLLNAVYDQLHTIAKARMGSEAAGHTLQATALINEAYPRLMSGDVLQWRDRGHFLGAAAEAMRRVLIDHARRKTRVKRAHHLQLQLSRG